MAEPTSKRILDFNKEAPLTIPYVRGKTIHTECPPTSRQNVTCEVPNDLLDVLIQCLLHNCCKNVRLVVFVFRGWTYVTTIAPPNIDQQLFMLNQTKEFEYYETN